MISLATETERTLFFDFLPLSLGEIRGFKTRFHLYTVPGQVFYDASRKLILKGVDGVIFVADSQVERIGGERRVHGEPADEPRRTGLFAREAPVRHPVQQARPARTWRPTEELRQMLNKPTVPDFEAVASTGIGVFDTLKAVPSWSSRSSARAAAAERAAGPCQRPPLPPDTMPRTLPPPRGGQGSRVRHLGTGRREVAAGRRPESFSRPGSRRDGADPCPLP